MKLWNLETKRSIETLRGHDGWIACCTLSPDGKWALSASHDQQVRLWNLGGYEETRVLGGHVLNGHSDAVLHAAISRDGKYVATASRDRTARLWSAVNGQQLKTYAEGHSFLSMQAIFSPDGKWLFTAAFDNTVRVWNVAHGTEVARLNHTGRNAALAVSPDGQFLVTGSDDETAKVWNLKSLKEAGATQKTPEPNWVLKDHNREITTIAISPSGHWIYTGDVRGRGRLWDSKTGEVIHRMKGHSGAITAAVFLADGSRVLTASRDKTVGCWDVATGKEHRENVLKHPGDVTSIALLPNGSQVITSCDDKTVRLWNLKTSQVERTLHQGDDIHTVDVSPNGQLALGLSSVEGRIRVWQVANGREVASPSAPLQGGPFFQLTSETDSLWSATFSPDNHGLLTVAGNDVRLWNLKTGEERMSFNPHGAVASAEFSPDGQRLVTAGWDHTARIWNIKTGLAEQKLLGQHTDDINHAVFSPDGRHVLTASDDATAVLWNLQTGQPELTLRGHTKRVNSAVFSRDGRWILTASDDRTARIWDAKTGEECLVIQGHDWAVQSAEFSSDGQRIITASDDNTARIWQLTQTQNNDGTATWKAEQQWVLKGHSAAVVAGGFSPDGQRVITGSRDDTVVVWDAET
ncbi:MAG: WD40 repeat domain-containing protein, partial [Planctomycetaceae bacterium]|nr:WD40 repeat domain-containing protein [Planctomycetaceae bacterium]